MENNFEKQLVEMLNTEKEMPKIVRKSIDYAYDQIRIKAQKGNRGIWKKGIVAACCIIIAGGMMTNQYVSAAIKSFLNFNDRGIQQAINNGFVENNNASAADKSINITLDSFFTDSNKMGLSFKLKFDDVKLLNENIRRISLDYRIKNGDGEYIKEAVPDTKTLKGKNQYISTWNDKNSILDLKNGIVQYDVILESFQGSIPKLNNAVVEVESVNIFYNGTKDSVTNMEKYSLKVINGRWNMPITNNRSNISSIEYVVNNNSSKIQVTSAKATPTSLNIELSIESTIDYDYIANSNIQLIDEKGNKYMSNGFAIDTKDAKTILSLNFSVTAYDNIDKLKLLIEGVGELNLIRK